MCGIGGFFLPDSMEANKNHKAVLDRLTKQMHPRGPDANGQTIYGSVGLMHTRLSIIDLDSRSNQPMESTDWILSYNGEIYNFKKIKSQLTSYSFKTSSDTEVLLASLQTWGLQKTLQHLAGMYAFLAYNKKSRHFFAVRDRMGIKPLFLTRLKNGEWYFASTPAALISALPDEPWRECKAAVASYFVLGASFTNSSVYEGIEKLEPAHYITIEPDGSFSKKCYWTPQFQDDFNMEKMSEIILEYETSDVKSALFLSGGIDSTYLASQLRNLDFFHLISSERNYAQAVARKYQKDLFEVRPEVDDYISSLKQVIDFYGEPLMSCGIPFTIANVLKAKGYKMAISANGADELLHGYPRTPTPEYANPTFSLYDEPTNSWFYLQLAHVFRDNRNFILEEYQDYLPSIFDLYVNAISHYRLTGFPESASHRWFELMTYVLHDLNPTLDAASMVNSVEVRVPFLDHRIVEGVLSWPAQQLISPDWGRKTPLKKAMEKDFPKSFFNRPKMGFSLDEKLLKSISKMVEAEFRELENQGFIKMKSKPGFGYYDRDRIYLRNSCFAYKIWKEKIRNETDNLVSEGISDARN